MTRGDIGYFDNEGFLYLSGRLGEIAKLDSGRKVNLSFVEQRLSCLAGVEQVVAIGHGYPKLIALVHLYDHEPGNYERSQTELLKAIRQINEETSGIERVSGIGFLDRPFSIEAGELTRNLKYRRRQIESNMVDLINQVYAALKEQRDSTDVVFVVA